MLENSHCFVSGRDVRPGKSAEAFMRIQEDTEFPNVVHVASLATGEQTTMIDATEIYSMTSVIFNDVNSAQFFLSESAERMRVPIFRRINLARKTPLGEFVFNMTTGDNEFFVWDRKVFSLKK